MRKYMAGRHYRSDEVVIAAVESFSGTKAASILQGSKDSVSLMLKNKSLLALAKDHGRVQNFFRPLSYVCGNILWENKFT